MNAVHAKFNVRMEERIRCNNGGEYTWKLFKEICKNHGIRCQYTEARNSEQNGVAERLNRTIMEKARCLLFDSKLNKSFWGEAVRAAIYLLNRTETRAVADRKTLAEIWYKHKPDLKKIKLFGCQAYNLVPKERIFDESGIQENKVVVDNKPEIQETNSNQDILKSTTWKTTLTKTY